VRCINISGQFFGSTISLFTGYHIGDPFKFELKQMSSRNKPTMSKSTKKTPQYRAGTPTAKVQPYGIKEDMRRIEKVESSIARMEVLEQKLERNHVFPLR
jgi:hypothetical protein